MIYNERLRKLMLRDETSEKALEVSDTLKDFFVLATEHREDKALVKQKVAEIVSALERLNELAEEVGTGPVYVKEGSDGEDIFQYFLTEFRLDDYGKKL